MSGENNKILFLDEDTRFPDYLGPWYNHEYINYYSIQTQSWLLDLEKIAIQKESEFDSELQNWPVGPNHTNKYKESVQSVRKESIEGSFDSSQKYGIYSSEPPGKKIEPWKVFVLYSIEPDLELDCGLNLNWTQKLTGGSHALRHMRFKVFGMKFGESHEALHHYIQAAKRSFELDNTYWGWRYLSRASHYLADLGHPFHVNIAPIKEILKMFLNFKDFMKLISATHTTHEAFVLKQFRKNYRPYKSAIQKGAIEGMHSETIPEEIIDFDSIYDKNIKKEIKKYIRRSANRMQPIHKIMVDNCGKELTEAYSTIYQEEQADLDLSKRTIIARKGAIKILNRSLSGKEKERLNKITESCLFDVGKMFGLMFRLFRSIIL
ncbi:MAG: hypothetical protein GF364_12295 [Candidatus Lokiarchaeota archaeon]|nr:hypothetical protein [Candidatus Lokiarchaeota archaeon]